MNTFLLSAHWRSIPFLAPTLLAAALTTAASATETWDDRFGVPNLNGQVFSVDVSATEVVAIGGQFTGNSGGNPGALNANRVALWNGTSWSTLGTGPDHGPGGTVHAVKWLGDSLYVGGEFAGANNLPANHLIRWDGASWHTLLSGGVTGLNGGVYALATGEDQLYVGGRFTTAGSIGANRVARWNGTGWSALGGGVSGGSLPVVSALAVASDGSVFVGGSFTSAGGVPAANIARWNGSTWTSLGTGLTGAGANVRAIAIAPNGDVVAGGDFTSAGGQPAQGLARWNGSAWQEVTGGVQEGEVYSLSYDGEDLWVGGDFTKANTYNVPYLGVLQNGVWQLPGIHGVNGEVRQIAVGPNGVYMVGSFQTAGDLDGLLGMVQWDRTRFQALHRGFLGGNVSLNGISVAGTNVVAVGSFESVGGRPAKGVARWDGEDWRLLGTPQNNGVKSTDLAVTALALPNGDVYVGGAFSQIAGVDARNIARWNGDFWQALGVGVQDGSNTRVTAIVQLPDGSLVVGGTFLSAGGQPAKNIARWDGENWSPLADGFHWSFDSNRGQVLALAWAGDRLYAAGGFDRSGPLAVNGIAWWDGVNWHAIDGGITYEGNQGTASALAVRGFEVFVGGTFDQAGTVSALRIARWSPGAGWSALGAGLSSGADALLVHGGRLYVAGNFEQAGGVYRPGLAAWDDTSWQAVNGVVDGVYTYATSLAAGGTDVYVGGGFDSVGGVVSTRFAKLNLASAPPAVEWLTPVADAILPNAAGIDLEVEPADEDGTVATVEFFVESSAAALATVSTAPWKYSWSGAVTGEHRFAARVTDDSGATTWTPVRRVVVLPPGDNAPPQVTITSPENGSTFKATTDRLLIANATDPDGQVVKVDFYSGNVPLGTATGAPWQIFWPDLQAGVYPLRAEAWDDSGAKAVSAVVNVTVLPPNDAPYLEINDIYEGTVMEDPGTLTLRATSSDGDGGLVSVELFLNGPRVARFTDQLDRWYFEYLWDPVPAGEHTFRVVSTDTDGATTERVVHFTVTPFNEPPEVTLFAPPDGSSIGMPDSIPLTVVANDPDGSIAEVQWLTGDAVLGSKTNAPWVFNLRNLAAADYYLRARAIDNLGKSTTTPTVTVMVTNDASAQPRYRLVDLTPPGGDEGEAYDINQSGQVSATIRNGDGNTRGYRYFDGVHLDLGDAVSPRQPAALYAMSVNDSGAVAGFGHINNLGMAFLWQNNTLTELGVLGERSVSGMFSRARAINNLGHVVGGSRNSNGVDRAFIYRDGQMTDLGSLGSESDSSEAFDLNDQGEVVGWSTSPAGRRAFVYDPVDGMRALGSFGDSQGSIAHGINQRGQIVGSYHDQSYRNRAFLWSGGIEVQLGTFGGESEAYDVNDLGQIVGTANIDGFGASAFLWQGCAMFDLNLSITNANWELVSASAINNDGWIVGYGRKDFQSARRAFLLIPEDAAGSRGYSPISFQNGRFQMCVPVPPGTTYRLDASIDLENWTTVSTNYVPEGVLDFRDPRADEHPTRFYRAILLP